MNLFKKSLASIAFFLLIHSVYAQERSREFYIATNNFLSFNQSIEYKSQFGENRYLRIKLGNLLASRTHIYPKISNMFPTNTSYASFNSSFGLENRKSLSDHITFYKGLNLILDGSLDQQYRDDPFYPVRYSRFNIVNIGLALSTHFGLMTEIKERFILGIHYEPNIGVSARNEVVTLRYNTFINLGPSQVRLLIGLKWNKKPKHQSSKTEEPTPAK